MVVAAGGVVIGLQHPGGEVLGDAVLHDLHGVRAEARRDAALAAPEDVGQLLAAAGPVPPQGTLDPGGQLAARRGGQVDRERVRAAEVVPHDGVLPRGDATGVQVLLGEQQPGQALLDGELGQQGADQVGRAFVQRALRAAVWLTLDPAVGRVRSPGVDARQLEGAGVGPGAVAVAVRQVRRPAAGHGVERLPVRCAAGEPLHPPARARYPLQVRMLAAVAGDPLQRLGQARRAHQVAANHGDAGEGRMHVRVLEARQQRPAAQVHDLGSRADQVLDVAVAGHSDGLDPAAHHRDGAGWPAIGVGGRDHPPPAGVGRVDGPAREYQFRLLPHARPPLSCAATCARTTLTTPRVALSGSPDRRGGFSRWILCHTHRPDRRQRGGRRSGRRAADRP